MIDRQRMTRTAAALLLVGGLLGCTPTDGPTVSPSPEESVPAPTPSSSPEPPVSTEETSGVTAPVPADPVPDDEFPAQVGEYTLVWTAGAASYDIDRGSAADSDRIAIAFEHMIQPAAEAFEGVGLGHEELRPGVWCYLNSRGADRCAFNGTTGRLWTATDMFDSLTPDELAEWTELFAAEIP